MNSFGARSTLSVGGRDTRSSGSTRCRRSSTSRGCRSRSRSCSRTCCATRTASTVDAERHRGAGQAGSPTDEPSREIAFTPARVLLQDFTGVPAIVDLAAMRDAMARPGRRPDADQPAAAGRAGDRPLGAGRRVRHPRAFQRNAELRVRAQPRALRLPALGPAGVRQLRGRAAGHRHLPPGQPRVPGARRLRTQATTASEPAAYPDTLVGHRLAHDDGQRPRRARLGRRRDRGRGGDARPAGLDADPAGGRLPADRRAAGGRDRDRPGADRHADAARARAWSASSSSSTAPAWRTCRWPTARRSRNMSPEYGATCGIFPVDAETLRYLRFTGRPERAGRAGRGLLPRAGPVPRRRLAGAGVTPTRSSSTWRRRAEPRRAAAAAGPRAAQRREASAFARGARARSSAERPTEGWDADGRFPGQLRRRGRLDDRGRRPGARCRASAASVDDRRQRGCGLDHGSVVIAAITSCTNTSNPSVMLGAGLLAKKAVERGLTRRPWVKTSLAPGLEGRHRLPRARGPDRAARAARLLPGRLRLHDLHRQLRPAAGGDLARRSTRATWRSRSVLSGNRNFEGRIHPEVKMNYLASPPLVVAYALAGRMDIDLVHEPLGEGATASRSTCATSGRRSRRSSDAIADAVESDMFRRSYGDVFAGDEHWNGLEMPEGDRYAWDPDSTYVEAPALLRRHGPRAGAGRRRSRAPACSRCSATASPPTTSRPAGAISADSPGGPLPDRARRRDAGLQLLRLAARQPRGDDARHVRQRAAAQPARARHRGRRDPCTCRTASR